eukprot:5353796-Pyramimonas_sp.AAC.1
MGTTGGWSTAAAKTSVSVLLILVQSVFVSIQGPFGVSGPPLAELDDHISPFVIPQGPAFDFQGGRGYADLGAIHPPLLNDS